MKVVLATLNAKYIHSSLALRYLKSYCRTICPDMVIRDYTINNPLLDILSDIWREQPAVVGLSCYIWNIELMLNLTKLLRKVLPATIIVLGGPEVSYDAVSVLESNPEVDYIVAGEGEKTFRTLIEDLKQGKTGTGPGLVYRDRNGTLVNGELQIMENLDSIPFPYTATDLENLKDKIIYYEASRGCPFTCQYCLSGDTRKVRFLSLQRVYSDLKIFLSHKVKQIKFVDRTSNADREYFRSIIKYLSAQETDTNFHFEITADLLDDTEVNYLCNAPVGRLQLEIGVQSTYPPALAAVDRHHSWSKLAGNVKQLRASGNLHLHLDLIVGLPYEGLTEFQKSFNDVYALHPHLLQIGFLKLLKGSGLRAAAAAHDYVFMDNAPYEVLANKYLSYENIRKLKIMANAFDYLYNDGRFDYSLEFFVKMLKGDAFDFYYKVADYWDQTGMAMVGHNVRSLTNFLLNFCRLYYPDKVDIFDNFLRFDVLLGLRNAGGWPELLSWNGPLWADEKTKFWRSEETVQKYLTGFRFTNWRDIKKKYHIEVFRLNVPEDVKHGNGRAELAQQAVLFDWTGRRTKYQFLAKGDFNIE